ncbi:MAG: hypothetical protein WCK89_21995, partial [bacterium]
RVREWQQYFISASHESAAPWALDGVRLEWSDNTGAAGTNSASPSGDSLRLPVGRGAETLTVKIVTTRGSGLARSPLPLYLLGWSPAVTFDTDTAFIDTGNGPALAVVSGQDYAPVGPGFTIDTAGRPHNASMSQQEYSAIAAPFGTNGVAFTAVAGQPGHYTLTGGKPGAYNAALPYVPASTNVPSSGGGGKGQSRPGGAGTVPFTLYLLAPTVTHHTGTESCDCRNDGADGYPFDELCLRTAWRNSGGCQALDPPGFSVDLGAGVSEGVFKVVIAGQTNTGVTAEHEWQVAERAADVEVRFLAASDPVWEKTVYREPESLYRGSCLKGLWDGGGCGGCGGCGSGDCDSAEGDGSGPSSVRFRIPVGFTGYKQTAGFVWFDMGTPQDVTPSLFQVSADTETLILEDGNGAPTNVVRYGQGGRDIRIEGITGGVRVSVRDTGEAEDGRVWEITRSGDTVNFVKTDAAFNTVRDVSYSLVYGGWTMTNNATKLVAMSQRYGNVTNSSEYTYADVYDASGLHLSGIYAVRNLIGAGPAAVVRETLSDEWDGVYSNWSETHMTYWKDSLNTLLNGRPKFRYSDGGGWEYRSHDARGRETLRVAPLAGSGHPSFKDDAEPFAFSPSAPYGSLTSLVTVTSYQPAQGDGDELNDCRRPREISTYSVMGGNPVLVSREWHAYARGTFGGHTAVTGRVTRAASQAAGVNDGGNLWTETVAYADDEDSVPVLLRGRPLREERSDGTLLTWDYELDAETLTVTSKRGTTALPDGIANVSTYEVETLDAVFGLATGRQTRLYTGDSSDPVISGETRDYDSKGRLLSVSYPDGTSESNIWSCCKQDAAVGRDGTRRDYWSVPGNGHWSAVADLSYGSLPGTGGSYPVTETFTDALGRGTNSVRSVWSNGAPVTACAPLVSRTEYPYGTDNYRVTTDPVGVQTVTYRYHSYGVNGEIEQTTSPGVT